MSKREQEIIAAAAKVFKEKGYHAATTRDIAAEVGIQQATLYYLPGKRPDLLPFCFRDYRLQTVDGMPQQLGFDHLLFDFIGRPPPRD